MAGRGSKRAFTRITFKSRTSGPRLLWSVGKSLLGLLVVAVVRWWVGADSLKDWPLILLLLIGFLWEPVNYLAWSVAYNWKKVGPKGVERREDEKMTKDSLAGQSELGRRMTGEEGREDENVGVRT